MMVMKTSFAVGVCNAQNCFDIVNPLLQLSLDAGFGSIRTDGFQRLRLGAIEDKVLDMQGLGKTTFLPELEARVNV
jgi:hypothetical protein